MEALTDWRGQQDTGTGQAHVGLVGAGAGGAAVLEVLMSTSRVKVGFVSDRDYSAPGMLQARDHAIPTFTDVEQALRVPVDFVIEATGDRALVEVIRSKMGPECQFVDHRVALFLFAILNDTRRQLNAQVITDITQISQQVSSNMQEIESMLGDITRTASSLKLISINALIEAARAGQQGAGFAIVARSVRTTAENAHRFVESIKRVNANNVTILESILESVRKLG